MVVEASYLVGLPFKFCYLFCFQMFTIVEISNVLYRSNTGKARQMSSAYFPHHAWAMFFRLAEASWFPQSLQVKREDSPGRYCPGQQQEGK